MEDGDSDPARFWSSVVEAMGRQCPSLAVRVAPLVIGSQGDGRVIVPALVNELVNDHEQLVVVIDDYHLIDSDSVHRGVERLIDVCPPELTVVLSTRVDPPFRLGRLRVRNQLIEIRAEDLRFASGEASVLLGAATTSLSATMLDELCTRTEGWAAGLVLAGLSLERAADPAQFVEAFRGDNQLVVSYLSDELLAATPPEDRQRLLETSILDRLTGSLVEAVTGSSDGRQWLTTTADHNQLVIRLGQHRRVVPLSPSPSRPARPRSTTHVSGTDPRAATPRRRLVRTQDDHAHAVEHRLAAGDVDAAMAAMRIVGPDLLGSGQVRTLRTLLDRIGPAGATDTVCALLWGWCHYITGRYGEAQESLDTALAVAPDTLRPRDRDAPEHQRRARAGRRRQRAGDRAGRHHHRGDLSLRPAELATAVGAAYAWAGYPDEARVALEIAIARARTLQRLTAHVLALVSLAIVEADDGNVAAARAAAANVLDTAQSYGLPGYHGIAPAFAVAARTATDPDVARTQARHAIELARRGTTSLGLAYVLTSCGDTLLDLGDDDGEALLAEAREVIDRCVDPGIADSLSGAGHARHKLGSERVERTEALVEQLTERELAVLKYLPTKLSQREIAAELYVSHNTVKTHASAIYRKLGVSDRKSAVQSARDLRLL